MKSLLPLALLVALPLAVLGKEDLSKYTGTYKGETRTTRHQTLTLTLSLGDDGTATLTQSPDAVSEITSFGHWTHQGDMIELDFDPLDRQPAPPPMTFRRQHRTLIPVVWNHSLWRTIPPPSIKRMKQHDSSDDL
jgi:hypothetical protein